MPKATKYHILISLTIFCLCLILFTPINQNAWPQDETEIQTLINELKSPDAYVRQQAAKTLGEMGPKAKAAVPTLVAALKDQDENVRRAAVSVLKSNWESKAAVLALIEALQDQSGDVRHDAEMALMEINTPEALTALEEYLQKS